MERITLNIVPKGITPVCHASQYDKGREIGLDLMDGLQGFVLSGTETLELRVRKPDNNVVTAAVENTSSAFVVFETTEQMTACEGVNLCELRITDGNDVLIGSLNFNMKVEVDPLKDGIESETEIHNLETQIADINAEIVPPIVAEEVANQYDSSNVIFDDHPTAGHGTGYVVKSENVPAELDDLSDVTTSAPTSGEALVWDGSKWTNGTVSTVGSIDDLNDVDTTGKANADSLRYNATAQEWEAKPTTVKMTLAEYTALGGDYSGYENTNIIITDAPNLNATAQDISYDGGADTVWDKVEAVKSALGELPTEIRCGSGSYTGLKGGGHPNRVNVPITFSKAMTGTQYAVFIVVSDAYSDYPYIQGYCFAGSRTANGFTATILSTSSDTTTVVKGEFYWVAVRYK